MKIIILFLSFIYLTGTINVYSQKMSKSILKDKFDDADYDFAIEDYYQAIAKYKFVIKYDSLNANVNYCIGVCYMKTKFDKIKAIPFLEKAIKKTSNKYDEGSFDEKKAKTDAFLLLGQAYRINKELDKAIEAFNSYKKLLPLKDNYTHALVDSEIEACNNAKKEVVKTFSSVSIKEIQELNSPVSDYNAVFSADEKTVVFASQQLKGVISEEKKIFFSKKNNNKWIKPIELTNTIKTNMNMIPTYLSPDGTYMLLAANEEGITAIYESKYEMYNKRDTGAWSPVKKLNKIINTGKVTHASLSHDGNIIFFTSDRKGGFGGLDIYKCDKNEKGDWKEAVNMGPKINSPYNEDAPFLTEANILFFSSGGHTSIGGLDLFYSKQDEKGVWMLPTSLGNMFNTTDDDDFYFPIGDGAKGYMSLIGEDDPAGEKHINRIEIINP